MVEKWLQSKPNPYIFSRAPTPKRGVRVAPVKMNSFRGPKAYYGKPIQLFKDSDRDGVPNVFDCKPYNRRRQDVMHPQNFGSGVGDMYARQENARRQKEYENMLKALQKQQDEANAKALADWNTEQQKFIDANAPTHGSTLVSQSDIDDYSVRSSVIKDKLSSGQYKVVGNKLVENKKEVVKPVVKVSIAKVQTAVPTKDYIVKAPKPSIVSKIVSKVSGKK